MNKIVLIIDDDIHIGNMLEETLSLEGYDVLRAYSGTEALMVLEKNRPDIILLDLMLPGLSGEELLPKVKEIPTIVVSAKTGVSDKVRLLMDGAADYVTKPFEIPELLARMSVALRKNGQIEATESDHRSIVRCGGLSLDTDTFTLSAEAGNIMLTRTECAILEILMLNHDRPIGRNTILDRIADSTPDCTERSLKQHISNIRKKMSAIVPEDHIEAIYGIGFKYKS